MVESLVRGFAKNGPMLYGPFDQPVLFLLLSPGLKENLSPLEPILCFLAD